MVYSLLLAGERSQLQQFRDWHAEQDLPRERLADVDEGSPQIGEATRRAGRFLSLAGLVAVLLCAVAVAMSARSYVRRHLDAVALMKTLGATRRFVLTVSVTQLLVLALAATIIGSLAGWLTQEWLVRVLKGLLRANLPPPGPTPVFIGLTMAVAMLAGFAPLTAHARAGIAACRRDAGHRPRRRGWPSPGGHRRGRRVYGTLGEWLLAACRLRWQAQSWCWRWPAGRWYAWRHAFVAAPASPRAMVLRGWRGVVSKAWRR
jgi:predicted lysophospholipase L1 biosynthesis ABC-type transport system permease subunit